MPLSLWLAVGALAVFVIGFYTADRILRWPHFVVVGVLVALGVLDAVNGVVGAFTVGEKLTGPEIWMGRLSTAVLLAAVVFGLARPRFQAAGRLLCYTGVAFVAVPVVVGMLMGAFPVGMLQTQVLTVGALVAIWAAPRVSVAMVVLVAKVALAITLVGSLVVLIVGAPDIWLEGEPSLIPGVPQRFQGATYHPNVLGPLPIVYLLLERYRPSPIRIRIPLTVLAIGALVLTQSKTAAAAGAIAAVIILAMDQNRSRNERIAAGMLAVALFIAFTAYVTVIDDVIAPDATDRFRTLSGRTRLWGVGIRAWLEQPITGAGALFFENWARVNNQLWAGQAHNQFVQTVAEQGLVGLMGLIAYTGVMIDSALRSSHRSNATSVALLLILLVRFLTETPMTGMGLEHWILYCLLIAWEREAAAEAAGGAVPQVAARPTAPSELVSAGRPHSGP